MFNNRINYTHILSGLLAIGMAISTIAIAPAAMARPAHHKVAEKTAQASSLAKGDVRVTDACVHRHAALHARKGRAVQCMAKKEATKFRASRD